MPVRVLLGPAGSGKTFRCLAEIRAALAGSPEGPPLVLLAPKQATFQLERQLLADAALAGYARLHILSFERLAAFLFERLRQPPPKLLSEEGRVMVLRCLLARKQDALSVFRASARQPGLPQQVSLVLREFQQHNLSVERLLKQAVAAGGCPGLAGKLRDLAVLWGSYLDWLKDHRLQDADSLLDAARASVRQRRRTAALQLRGLWVDGFAEMTPQELDLMAELMPACEDVTVALCLESPQDSPWLSPGSVVGRTFRRLCEKLSSAGIEVSVEVMGRDPTASRFTASPALRHLEEWWARPKPYAPQGHEPAGAPTCSRLKVGDSPKPSGTRRSDINSVSQALRLAACADPETEAVLAAREILRHVREEGGRFRDCAVLLRGWESYHEVWRRVFKRYEIPCFIDRREPSAHHPLAELTRYALRLVAFGWQREDWFGALKTGLVPARDEEIDQLENAALACGWKGGAWLEPLAMPAAMSAQEKRLEQLRLRLVPPFQQLAQRMAGLEQGPTGAELAGALRRLWEALEVERRLEEWSAAPSVAAAGPGLASAIHATVWEQMNGWLDNLKQAFEQEPMPVREWLPILEAGLADLSVGVIPPALDQVLIGTVDRSRNPDLQLALVPGLNESVFPATPPAALLLSESERETLEQAGLSLGLDRRARYGQERYYGYIAFTRPRRRLVLSYAQRDAEGHPLNPSPFVHHLKRLFPSLEAETWTPPAPWTEAAHLSELAAPWLRFDPRPVPALSELERAPRLAKFRDRLARLAAYAPDERLTPALGQRLYGTVLRTSVSALERFAACPFQFFVHTGLRLKERPVFELEARERGSFQHEVLARFHQRLRDAGLGWRDLTPAQAREQVGGIADELAAEFGQGIFRVDPQSRFIARGLRGALQDFIEAAVGWLKHNQFDPRAVEVDFGFEDSSLPAWEIDLGDGHRLALRGQVDRVDVCRVGPEGERALCVVLDYKSSPRRLDALLLEHGIQMQLPAYLAALSQMTNLEPMFGVGQLEPAGMFYVNLRGAYESGANRTEALCDPDAARRQAYRHEGNFRQDALSRLDALHAQGGSQQFVYRLTKAGQPRDGAVLAESEFLARLERVPALLRSMGQRIYAGDARVDPYRRSPSETACAFCLCRAICRVDPARHPFRVLRKDEPR